MKFTMQMAFFSNVLHWKKAICVWQILGLNKKKGKPVLQPFFPQMNIEEGRKKWNLLKWRTALANYFGTIHAGIVGLHAIIGMKYFYEIQLSGKKLGTAVLFSLFLNSGNWKHKFELWNYKQRNKI